ncbi:MULTISPECIES: polyprenyl synthetase family protein [Yimella]|uniref:Heptaprenyl diphosphate synthase n=1 Tax=Yimella lutea TaxID=587872 RepID=A0A542EDV1_9MICO|nr:MULTISPECIES: polyprenyl synthetase family protein [Yimella]MCG8656263.1 polyprenyl synthetase family protein [Yimella sp. NH-Cas1]RYG77546.1 polyprenyl synthetase family protein [Yimella sp. RIT 621]TQJ13495.1 heptaprenyl diphosphate synthase [Yimella lutea]
MSMSTSPTDTSTIGVPGASEELATRLAEGLTQVDARLREVVQHDDPFIAGASKHLVEAGGKRFRPLLTLLACELGDGRNEQVVDAAVGVELTHLASLYHDDVMDEADLRRGVPSANAEYDNSTAILIGDLLFGKASAIMAGLGPDAVRIQAETFVRLCTGQIEDDRQAPADADPMAHYLDVLADKTGSLIATAARYGAMFSGAADDVVETLTKYGELVGMVFQLADDVLDVSSDVSGKPAGTDLREGVRTLPVLYALASTDPADDRLKELVSRPLTDPAEHAEALALLRAHPALQQAREHTVAVAASARALLDGLGDSDAVQTLRALPEGVAERSA